MTALTKAAERLAIPDAVLSRTDLQMLGWQRRAIDQIFRALPVICLPGYTRPLYGSPTISPSLRARPFEAIESDDYAIAAYGRLGNRVKPSGSRVSLEKKKRPGDRANGPGAWPIRRCPCGRQEPYLRLRASARRRAP